MSLFSWPLPFSLLEVNSKLTITFAFYAYRDFLAVTVYWHVHVSEAWVKFFSHKTNFSDLDNAARFPRKAAPRFTPLLAVCSKMGQPEL